MTVLAQPAGGGVLAGLVGDLQHDPDLADGFHRDVVPARREAMIAALERGRARGEIDADADLELAVDALHGAVFYRLLLSGEPLDADFADTPRSADARRPRAFVVFGRYGSEVHAAAKAGRGRAERRSAGDATGAGAGR